MTQEQARLALFFFELGLVVRLWVFVNGPTARYDSTLDGSFRVD